MKLSKSPKGLKVFEVDKNTNNKIIMADLYDTRIFTLQKNSITLNSGGWRIMHTKKCINLICKDLNLPIYVQQVKGQWRVNLPNNVQLPFIDGIEINL